MLENVNTTVSITPIGECSAPVNLKAVESNASVMLDWEYATGDGPSLVGFNIYRNDEPVVSYLTDLSYTDCNLAAGSYLYKIEAFHSNSCVAMDSIQIDVTLEGKMMPPSYLALEKDKDDAGDYSVEMNWGMPYYEEPLALGYCGSPYSGTCFEDGTPLWALVGWDSAGLDPYRDLYIVGMEFFVGEGVDEFYGTVFVNNAQVLMCTPSSRIRESEWNTMIFPEFVSMDQPVEALVGYKLTYTDYAQITAVFDAGPGVAGYGDLISNDGQQWTTLNANGISANWCINALVVAQRDLEEAKKSGANLLDNPKVKTMSLTKLGLAEPKAVSGPKATSESVKLLGFNVYRDGEKLNPEMLRTLSYTDMAVPEGSYEYSASAVYSAGEVKCNPVLIDVDDVANESDGKMSLGVQVYPNPASDLLHIRGSYVALDVFTLSGQQVARYENAPKMISVSALQPGMYVLDFELSDGA